MNDVVHNYSTGGGVGGGTIGFGAASITFGFAIGTAGGMGCFGSSSAISFIGRMVVGCWQMIPQVCVESIPRQLECGSITHGRHGLLHPGRQ